MGNGTRKEKEKEGPFSFSILCQVRRAGQGIWTLITLLAMHRPSPLEMLMIYAWLILTAASASAAAPATRPAGVTWGKRASACSNGRHASIPFFPRGRVSWWLGRHPIPMQLQSADAMQEGCRLMIASIIIYILALAAFYPCICIHRSPRYTDTAGYRK